MSARNGSARFSMLRLRRRLDVDAVTVWAGVMGFFAFAAGAALAAH